MTMIDYDTLDCATCGMAIVLLAAVAKRRRGDGHTFFCPAGHHNVFPGGEVAKLEKEIEQLKRVPEKLQREHDAAVAELVRLQDATRARPGGVKRHREIATATKRKPAGLRWALARLKREGLVVEVGYQQWIASDSTGRPVCAEDSDVLAYLRRASKPPSRALPWKAMAKRLRARVRELECALAEGVAIADTMSAREERPAADIDTPPAVNGSSKAQLPSSRGTVSW